MTRARCGPRLGLAATRCAASHVGAENRAHPDGSIEHIAGPVVEDIAGGGDQESFVARLSRLPPQADRSVFTVSSFDGSTFETVRSAHCRVVDERLGHELARYAFPAYGRHTALIMAEVTRADGAWTMTALCEPVACTTFADLLRAAEGVTRLALALSGPRGSESGGCRAHRTRVSPPNRCFLSGIWRRTGARCTLCNARRTDTRRQPSGPSRAIRHA
ncbi:TerD family protein [Streptomyces venezuelae]